MLSKQEILVSQETLVESIRDIEEQPLLTVTNIQYLPEKYMYRITYTWDANSIVLAVGRFILQNPMPVYKGFSNKLEVGSVLYPEYWHTHQVEFIKYLKEMTGASLRDLVKARELLWIEFEIGVKE